MIIVRAAQAISPSLVRALVLLLALLLVGMLDIMVGLDALMDARGPAPVRTL